MSSDHTPPRPGLPGRRTTLVIPTAVLALALLASTTRPTSIVTAGPGTQIAQQVDVASIHLPATLNHAQPWHFVPARPVVPTVTGAPTRTAPPPPPTEPVPSPTAGPPVCAVPLAGRLVKREIPVDAAIAQGTAGQWTRYPMYTAVRDDGSSLVGWSTTGGQAHFTPLDRAGQRAGADLVVKGESVAGLVALGDGGGAALIARPDELVLMRWDADGKPLFELPLVGTESHSKDGSKWIDDWGYEGRLAWTGRAFAAYFGHTQWWGSKGKHQGDLLWLFDENGSRVPQPEAGTYPTWDWGCSHSLDVRLAHNATSDALGPVCLSDGFPYPGFIFRDGQRIGEAVSADGHGRADGRLGGIVPLGRGFAVNYATKSGRRSYDVALTLLDDYGFSLSDVWLTSTPSVDEDGPHLARYGDNLLAAWTTNAGLLATVVDLDGQAVEGPVALDARMVARDDIVNYPSGDVGWTYAGPDRRTLVSAVIPFCQ